MAKPTIEQARHQAEVLWGYSPMMRVTFGAIMPKCSLGDRHDVGTRKFIASDELTCPRMPASP
jgi:hypothetical protein